MQAPKEPLSAAEPGEANLDALRAKLDELAKNKDLATFGGEVIDTETGDVVWQRDADKRLTPASSTKVLTTAAATLALDENERITTKVYRGSNERNVVIKAAGDVWMTHEQLDDLAEQISKNVEQVDGVYIDTSVWSGEAQAPGWDPEDVDGGFVAPMEPAMLYGGRLGATTGTCRGVMSLLWTSLSS